MLWRNERTHVEFRSDAFPAVEGEEHQVNPGLWGKRLAEFLAAELPGRGFEPAGVVAEDWGWRVDVANEAFPLWIGCGHYEEHPDGFLVFIEPSRPFVRRWLRKVETRGTVERLADALDGILRDHPRIRAVSWWRGDQPVGPRTPEFPLTLTWNESGEVETFEDEMDVLTGLEDFDTDDPARRAEATIVDAAGRRVRVQVKIWTDLCVVELEEPVDRSREDA